MAEAEVEQHEPNQGDPNLAFAALCLILHSLGGELTVTAEQVESFFALSGPQMAQKVMNDDKSITFTLMPCPMHNCQHGG
jgi:hypothetical protein